ncbi:hypothetical protein HPB48_004804 [Haemaphysalis longicornis]|uniref:Uncharacterized protein n=1 Tax=Haemaphysalis longicornis TaxID=44386 RepID=A0A9J6FDE5_HAELO|nr:hypothetical protein HPB48_004804 [Haemaphysalis longicornis]
MAFAVQNAHAGLRDGGVYGVAPRTTEEREDGAGSGCPDFSKESPRLNWSPWRQAPARREMGAVGGDVCKRMLVLGSGTAAEGSGCRANATEGLGVPPIAPSAYKRAPAPSLPVHLVKKWPYYSAILRFCRGKRISVTKATPPAASI